MVENFYRLSDGVEVCFNIEVTKPLTPTETEIITWLLSETFEPQNFARTSLLAVPKIEVGPLLNYATPWNTNALSICHACGLTKITRIEKSIRTPFNTQAEADLAAPKLVDRMTQGIYPEPLKSFDTGRKPEAVKIVQMINGGPDELLKIPGLSMDAADREFYFHYFVELEKRNPTIVEIMDLNNANSEHCRHGYFKGQQIIDGKTMPETLMEIVKSTLDANPNNSILAFCDNSSGLEGFTSRFLVPKHPGQRSAFEMQKKSMHFIFTAETHNFPTTISPYAGAETGTGGRIRDIQATGRGGLTVAGSTGYYVGNLYIPGYKLPWEQEGWDYPSNVANGLKIMIEGSNGASDYGNKFGEPVINGTAASVGIMLPDGERQEYIKAILETGGLGMLDDRHIEKDEAQPGMLIVQVGGPAYRIGFGGGSASSLSQGDQAESLDFNAVQRGDGEMGQKVNRVIRACVEMGSDNPIVIVHDQGAGGPANVLKELVEKYGGEIDIRKIKVGDPTLSVLEIWICEYQERNGFIIAEHRLEEFQTICKREKVNCEVLGEVTFDGYFTVKDSNDGSTPVELDLNQVLGGLPQKIFRDEHISRKLIELELPQDFTIEDGLERILKLVSVGSKDHLTAKVDRSVTGLIAQQQCCGSVQIPVADFGIISQSHFFDYCGNYPGAVTAIGEKHLEMMLNPQAAARMTIAEMLTNMAPAVIYSGLESIKISANWMWAPKLPGEGARLYDAAVALRDMMVKLEIAIDGGKDSLSMATRVTHSDGTTEIVKSPSQLILSGYAPMDDITKKVTPDIKHPGKSYLIRVDLAQGQRRLGGSALAQAYSQIGNNYPDIKADILKHGFNAIQELVINDLISACHDISKGGLITTVLEMAFAGNCGFNINFETTVPLIAELFAEEAGWVIECPVDDWDEAAKILKSYQIPYQKLGSTMVLKEIVVAKDQEVIFFNGMEILREKWGETSHQLEKLQITEGLAKTKKVNINYRAGAKYKLNFAPKSTGKWLFKVTQPKVAIIREEGSNGDREMTAAFYLAGFDVYDITMSDLLLGVADLDEFQMVAFVGGFSYADVLDSAKGWAGVVKFNETLKQMFEDFFLRPNTLSLGICNGCQFVALTGLMFPELPPEEQPRFIKNDSGRFESHFLTVKIAESPAVMLQGMEGSTLGVWSAHGEGKVFFPDRKMLVNGIDIFGNNLAPIRYALDDGEIANYNNYPFNPNGSPDGIAGLCSKDGRHLIMMPHPERAFLPWQWAYWPKEWSELETSPWLQMFQNARAWCEEYK